MTKLGRHYDAVALIHRIDAIILEEEGRPDDLSPLQERLLHRLKAELGLGRYKTTADIDALLAARAADAEGTLAAIERAGARLVALNHEAQALLPDIGDKEAWDDLTGEQIAKCRLVVAKWNEMKRIDENWRARGLPLITDENKAAFDTTLRGLEIGLAEALEADRARTRAERLAERSAGRSGPENASQGHLCVVCGKRPRRFDDYCKRCVPAGLRPRGKVV